MTEQGRSVDVVPANAGTRHSRPLSDWRGAARQARGELRASRAFLRHCERPLRHCERSEAIHSQHLLLAPPPGQIATSRLQALLAMTETLLRTRHCWSLHAPFSRHCERPLRHCERLSPSLRAKRSNPLPASTPRPTRGQIATSRLQALLAMTKTLLCMRRRWSLRGPAPLSLRACPLRHCTRPLRHCERSEAIYLPGLPAASEAWRARQSRADRCLHRL